MTTYQVTLQDGQKFIFRADLAEATAQISVNFHAPDEDTDWQTTPYQTADAAHSPETAARLLAEHFATDEDDCTDVATVRAMR